MSFRTEFKIILHQNKFHSFVDWLNRNEFKKIYKPRKVFSTYYDNYNFQMFRDSEEGIIPRKKIRIRSYDKYTHNSNSNFEIKISSLEGRFKKTYKNKIINQYYDKDYGYVMPVINVSYLRRYFFKEETRLTIDSKIYYSNLNNTGGFKVFEKYIIEFKTKKRLDDLNILNNFNISNVRYSKYCEAIKSYYNFI